MSNENKSVTQNNAKPQISEEKKSINRMKTIHTIIGLAIMLLFPLLPPLEPITEIGMTLVGVFVGMVYLWSTVDSKWPSLLGLILVGLSGYASMNEVILGSFGDDIIITCVFAMILFGALDYYGSSKYIARWFVTRPIINRRPYVFITLMMLCGYTLSMLTSSIPGLLVTWPIVIEMSNSLDIKKEDDIFPILLVGTFFAVCLGHPVLPFKGVALIITGAYFEMTGIEIGFLPYISFNFILNALCIIAYLGLIKFVFKPDLSKLANVNVEEINKNPLPPINQRQRVFLYSVAIFIILMLIPVLLPVTVPGVMILKKLGAAGVTIVIIIVLSMLKMKDGQPALEFIEVASRKFSWDVYLLLAAALFIAKAISSPETGINEYLISILRPLLAGKPDYVFAIIISITIVIMTNIANNAGMVLILLPVIIAFAEQSGLSPMPYAVLIMPLAFIGMLTPSASPHSGIMHGRTDLLDVKDIYKIGIPATIVSLIIFIMPGIPLAKLLFG